MELLSCILSSPRVLEILENACEGVERNELKKVLKVSKSHFTQLLKKSIRFEIDRKEK